jgi:hypothetical protein
MEIHFKIIGTLFVILAWVHVIFPTYFKWKTELQSLSLINRQIMQVHTFFIALIVFLMGLLCLTSSHELVNTDFGRKIDLGLGIFWLCRLFIQFFGYSSKLWKGKTFETTVHILFSCFWLYLVVVFFAAYWGYNF